MIKVSVMTRMILRQGWITSTIGISICPWLKEKWATAASPTRSIKDLAAGCRARPRLTSECVTYSATSVDAFQAGFGPHAEEIMADIKNYTDLTPVIQISEVVVG